MPGRELDATDCAIGHFCAHHSPGGIVIHDGCDTVGLGQLTTETAAKRRFILLDRLALVVENGQAVDDPA